MIQKISAGFIAIVIIAIIVTLIREYQNRKNDVGLTLPNLDELEKMRRIENFKKNRSEFDFSLEKKLSEKEFADLDIDDESSKYLRSTGEETSILDDFCGLVNEDNSLNHQKIPIKIIKSDVDLPPIEEVSEDTVSFEKLQANSSNEKMKDNINNLKE